MQLCLTNACSNDTAGALASVNAALDRLGAKYAALPASGSPPSSLFADLKTLTKLAKAGQVELAASVKACCAGGSGDFGKFTAGLDAVVDAQVVNSTAIAHALRIPVSSDGEPAGTLTPESGSLKLESGAGASGASLMAGRLMNTGAVKGCSGQYNSMLDDAIRCRDWCTASCDRS